MGQRHGIGSVDLHSCQHLWRTFEPGSDGEHGSVWLLSSASLRGVCDLAGQGDVKFWRIIAKSVESS